MLLFSFVNPYHGLIFCVGTDSGQPDHVVHTVYFINSASVGIVVSHYLSHSGINGHPSDFTQKVYMYAIASAQLTDKGIIDQQNVFNGWLVLCADTVMTIDFYYSRAQIIPYFSPESVLRDYITLPADLNLPNLRAVSPIFSKRAYRCLSTTR